MTSTLVEEEITWDLVITHSTVDEGDLIITNAKITIDPCVITDIDPPTDPSLVEYFIFANSDLVIDLSTPGF